MIKTKAIVIDNKTLCTDIHSLWLEVGYMAKESKAGQFISVYSHDASRLLPRPISICEKTDTKIRLVFRIAGKGTEEFSKARKGDTFEVLGPLGNGYSPEAGKRAVLIGGGIGIPPILQLARETAGEKVIVCGYKDEVFLREELEAEAKVFIATEDGSTGIKGTVLDAIRENRLTGDVIYACGPIPMLKAVKAYAGENTMDAWISLEEKMACGIGACLACVCTSLEIDDHSYVKNKRICKDGPVFNAAEVIF